MPLNEREQRILDEIEKRLYEEDPKFQERVRKVTVGTKGRRWQRIAAAAFAIGLVVMLISFTRSVYIAGAAFVVMVVSAGWLAMSLRAGRAERSGGTVDNWLDTLRQRWRRDR
ncbi:MAG: DUF3040 domain-containing protein [Actinobacteria bacterium]|nr:MAG: DUF3040 domain-containing protein [Actinomycetota bacterium]